MPDADFDDLARELKAIERRVAGEITLRRRSVTVPVSVAVLVVLSLLPAIPEVAGWQLLVHVADGELGRVSGIARVFAVLAGITVTFSVLAVVLRRWVLALLALAGACLSTVFGLLGLWSQNTMPGYAHPTVVLFLEWIVVATLIPQWAPVVWSRSALDDPPRPRS